MIIHTLEIFKKLEGRKICGEKESALIGFFMKFIQSLILFIFSGQRDEVPIHAKIFGKECGFYFDQTIRKYGKVLTKIYYRIQQTYMILGD